MVPFLQNSAFFTKNRENLQKKSEKILKKKRKKSKKWQKTAKNGLFLRHFFVIFGLRLVIV
jgi:hypothetical protein